MDYTMADTIAKWLGGYSTLSMMLGVRVFDRQANSLQFEIPIGEKANHICITYNHAHDLYDVTFSKGRGYSKTVVEETTEMYGEDLVDYFERFTGLCLTPPVIMFSRG